MSDSCLLKPDREFVARIVGSGGDDLKKCFQCATCSVVCELAPDDRPFPRKEMIWAQWGLKDRLVADPDVWLCHRCNDCSTRCPRGARPADVLAAIREQSVEHYAVPRFLPALVNRVRYLPVTLVIGVALLVLALLVRGPLESVLPVGAPHGFYAEFFPHWLLIGFFSSFTGLAFVAALIGVVRFWRAMKAADASADRTTPALGVVPSVVRVLKSIVTHDKFGLCRSASSRRLAHLSAFYGFVALFVVTIWAVTDLYINPLLGIESAYPFKLLHPMKIVANVGCLVLIFGCVKAIRDRMGGKLESGASTPFDWIFLWLLLSVAVTGLTTEIMRFTAESGAQAAATAGRSGLEYAAFAVYFVHLVLVFELLVYLPYSKFAHIVYRTVALVYAEHSGRNRRAHPLPAPGVGRGRQDVPVVEAGPPEPALASMEATDASAIGAKA